MTWGATGLGLAVVSGCGSGDAVSVFLGTWGGNWRDSTGQAGALHLTVAADNAVTGTISNIGALPGTVMNGTVTGTVTPAGQAVLTYTFGAGRQAMVANAQGQVTRNEQGLVTGTLSLYEGAVGQATTPYATVEVLLWAPAAFPFDGDWSGPWQDTVGQSGQLDLAVTTDGVVSGTATNVAVVPGQVITATCHGIVDYHGVAVLYYVYPDSAVYRGAGTVVRGNNGHITGQLGTYQGATLITTATIDLTPG